MVETNILKWIDPATGLRCMILKQELGFLCGYVRIPSSPLRRRLAKYRRIPRKVYLFRDRKYCCTLMYDHHDLNGIEVHGGITFLDRLTRRNMKGMWVGFDCAHSGDLIPGLEKLVKQFPFPGDTYKDFYYVSAEVTKLAKQIQEIIVCA